MFYTGNGGGNYKQVETLCKESGFKYIRNISNIGIVANPANAYLYSENYEYIWIPGDDDILFEDAVDKVLDILNKNKDLDFLCISDLIEDESYFEIKDYSRRDLSLRSLIEGKWFAIMTAHIHRVSYIKDSIREAYKDSHYPTMNVFFHSIYKNNDFKICTTSYKNYYKDFAAPQADGSLRCAKLLFKYYLFYENADEKDRMEYLKKVSSFMYIRHYMQHYYNIKKLKDRADSRYTMVNYYQFYGYLCNHNLNFIRTKFFIWKLIYPFYRWVMDIIPGNLKDKYKSILGV